MQDPKCAENVHVDQVNLKRTAEYSRTHNPLSRNLSLEEIQDRLMAVIQKKVNAHDFEIGRMEMAYDVWFVIDKFPNRKQFEPQSAPSDPPSFEVNFFVRLGRFPNLGIVGSGE